MCAVATPNPRPHKSLRRSLKVYEPIAAASSLLTIASAAARIGADSGALASGAVTDAAASAAPHVAAVAAEAAGFSEMKREGSGRACAVLLTGSV